MHLSPKECLSRRQSGLGDSQSANVGCPRGTRSSRAAPITHGRGAALPRCLVSSKAIQCFARLGWGGKCAAAPNVSESKGWGCLCLWQCVPVRRGGAFPGYPLHRVPHGAVPPVVLRGSTQPSQRQGEPEPRVTVTWPGRPAGRASLSDAERHTQALVLGPAAAGVTL